MKIRVLVVDDHSFIRHALKISLEGEPSLQIIGEAENGAAAISQVASLHPHIVLMDIQMPEMDGVESTRQICQAFPDTKVLILTIDESEELVSQALKNGASGYILKTTPPEELAFAIQAVYRGYMHLDLNLGRRAVAKIPESHPPQNLWEKLTPREQEIVKLVATGASNCEIADKLYISPRTVKNHMTSILSQLNLRNRTQIAILAASRE